MTTSRKFLLIGAFAAIAALVALQGWWPRTRQTPPSIRPTTAPAATPTSAPAASGPTAGTSVAAVTGTPAPAAAAETPEMKAAMDAIRTERIQWLMRKLHAGTLSILDLQYGAAWLKAALADETTCRRYTEYLEQLSQDPDNRRMLGLAMGALAEANPSAYAQVLRDAIRNGNASLAAAGLSRAYLAHLPASEFLELAKGAAALGDPYAAYSVIRGIPGMADGLSREQTRTLLQEVYSTAGDAGVQSRAYTMLAGQGLVDPDKDWKMFAEQAANGRTAEQRYLGMVHLLSANAGLIGQQTDGVSRIRSACDVMPTMANILVDQLNDPDPLVRLAAARYYESFARDLDDIARSVQVAGSLEATVAGR